MHIQEGSKLGTFFSDTIHYQTGEVLLMYLVIFIVLLVTCIGNYQSRRLRCRVVQADDGGVS